MILYYISEYPHIAIFDEHRSAVSKSLSDPIGIAELLYKEHVINEDVLLSVKSSQPVSKQCEELLMAVRGAVKHEHRSLQIFGEILFKFDETIQLGQDIINEYDVLPFKEEDKHC